MGVQVHAWRQGGGPGTCVEAGRGSRCMRGGRAGVQVRMREHDSPNDIGN